MAPKRSNNRWLHHFIKQYQLSRVDVADAVCVNKSTVDRWLLPPPARGKPPENSYRHMPDMAVKLLTLMADIGEFEGDQR